MDDAKLAEFLRFAKNYRQKFKQISEATRREYEPEDVQNEAWLLAEKWERNNAPISFNNSKDIDRLFALLLLLPFQ